LRAQSERSEPVSERTKPVELSINVDFDHHKRGARVDQVHRGPSHDAYPTINACLPFFLGSSGP
jgi:hypothetical protein